MKIRFGKNSGWSLLETMMAIVVVGIGTSVYMTMQNSSGSVSKSNSNLFKAGQLIEKHIEGMRNTVAKDTINNWPPKDVDTTENTLKLKRTISDATSPKPPYAVVTNVKKVDIVVSWGNGVMDELKVTTYVSKRF